MFATWPPDALRHWRRQVGKGKTLRISSLGEFGLIDLLAKGAPRSEKVRVGIGDDTALVATEPGMDYLLTCDMLYEGVHFRRSWYEGEGRAKLLGRKALGVNVSDIASKGGHPRFCLVTLGAEACLDAGFLRAVYDGLYELADECGVSVVGGDTVGLPQGLLLDVFLAGEVAPGAARLRSGARPGDAIAVTGEFGLARAGLQLLDHPLNRHGAPYAGPPHLAEEAIARQLATPVRLAEALTLMRVGPPHAMSDTSDGLANQVHHICRASGVGAVIDASAVPVAMATEAVARWAGRDPLDWALWGGEDYELMLTLHPGSVSQASKAVLALGATSLTVVGEVTEGESIVLVRPGGAREPLAFGGYDHFPAASAAPIMAAPSADRGPVEAG